MVLPESFKNEMRELLRDEYPAFLAEYEKPAYRGIRLNTLKCDEEVLRRLLPFPISPAPFSPLSFYAPSDLRLGSFAAHHAGMFYAQEPSASSAVTLLDPRPGERILDLCAAPGGKTTQIAALTGDRGLLIANEIVRSRAAVLASNIERMGIQNAIVTSCRPDQLENRFCDYFDRILVDAPCSGEGMFRHDENAVSEWSEQTPSACAARQAEILDSAANMLRPGGYLVYSTCTFSKCENEEQVERFLGRHPEFAPDPCTVPFGRPVLGGAGVRIYPMDGGEGHFAVRLKKAGGEGAPEMPSFTFPTLEKQYQAALTALTDECFRNSIVGIPYHPKNSDTIYILPKSSPDIAGLPIVRAGYEIAKICGNRLEPCHAAYLCRQKEDCRVTVDFASDDDRLSAYLRGEEIECPPSLRGYAAVCLEGIPLGFGKASGGRLKNKYPKGLRNHK